MNTNILITSAGKRVALVRAFKESLQRHFPQARVYTTDMCPEMAPAAYVSDGCTAVPRVTAPEYPDILARICAEKRIGLVIPTIDTELAVLAAEKERFEARGTDLCVSSPEFIRLCRDKRLTGAFFESKGIRIPAPVDKNKPRFPLFAKPYDGSLSADLHHIRCAEELTPDILANPRLIFMEYIDRSIYKEYTVDIYYGRDHNLKMAVPRERIEIRAGEINKGRTVKALEPYIRQHLGHIDGCRGCICVQLFHEPVTADTVAIEINPRFGGGYPLSYAAGADYPELLIREYLLDQNPDYSGNWTDNLKMLRFDDAVFV